MGEGREGAPFSHSRAWATNVQAALLAQDVQEALPALGLVEGQSAHSHHLSGQGRASSSHSCSSHRMSKRHSRQGSDLNVLHHTSTPKGLPTEQCS